jgi:hypothetical protein
MNAAIAATAISAAIKPYSIAVAPSSFRRRSIVVIGIAPPLSLTATTIKIG